jgi:hypothetical protein
MRVTGIVERAAYGLSRDQESIDVPLQSETTSRDQCRPFRHAESRLRQEGIPTNTEVKSNDLHSVFEAVKLEEAGSRCLKAASAAAGRNETKTHIDH